MKTIEQKIVETYEPTKTSLRDVALIVGTDHHKVKRVLMSNGITPVRAKKRLSDEHKNSISKSCKGRATWSKGKKMPKKSLYKNMASHIRFNVSVGWLQKFEDIEKLKFLNRCITSKGGRFPDDTKWYIAYIEKFYTDSQFNKLYEKWINSEKNKWFRPSIDHINPKSKKGTNDLSNLQFLSWFENRCKNDMTQEDWDNLKSNIKEYMI